MGLLAVFFPGHLSKVRSQSQYGIPTWKEDHLGSRMGQVDQSGDGRWCYLECCCGGRKGWGRESCVPKIYDILLLSIMHADCWVCWKVQRSSASWGWSITSYSRWKGLNRPTWWIGRIFFQQFMRIGKPGRSGSFDEQAGPHPLQGRWDSAPLRES